jgi:hypothetical protein
VEKIIEYKRVKTPGKQAYIRVKIKDESGKLLFSFSAKTQIQAKKRVVKILKQT